MIDLALLDDALINRVISQVPAFNVVKTLDAVEQLTDSATPSPAAFVVVGGVQFNEAPGASREQAGFVEVAVYIKTHNLSGKGAARKSSEGSYVLANGVIDALLGYQPLPCLALYLVVARLQQATKTRAIFEVRFRADLSQEY